MVNPVPASPTISRFATADLDLAVETRGPQGGPVLLFAHGFGQTRGAWNSTAAALAQAGCRCVTFDARGHGESDRVPGGSYHMDQFADDLRRLAAAQPQPPILVGASMGGLLGIVLAGELRPSPFRALVLVDITPRWETAGVERILAFMQAHPDGFANYAEAAEQIAAYLPQRRERKSEQQLRPLLREGADGRLRWHWDPALLAGDLVQESERYQPRLQAAARRSRCPCCCCPAGAATWCRAPPSTNSCSWCRTRSTWSCRTPRTWWPATRMTLSRARWSASRRTLPLTHRPARRRRRSIAPRC